MEGTILLNHNDNTKKIEAEERLRFLKDLLENMGIPISEFWVTETQLSIEQRQKLREIYVLYGIQVIDDLDGHMKVFVENELIGEWYKCNYKLKRDFTQLDPKKQLFLEMEIKYWSVFE